MSLYKNTAGDSTPSNHHQRRRKTCYDFYYTQKLAFYSLNNTPSHSPTNAWRPPSSFTVELEVAFQASILKLLYIAWSLYSAGWIYSIVLLTVPILILTERFPTKMVISKSIQRCVTTWKLKQSNDECSVLRLPISWNIYRSNRLYSTKKDKCDFPGVRCWFFRSECYWLRCQSLGRCSTVCRHSYGTN